MVSRTINSERAHSCSHFVLTLSPILFDQLPWLPSVFHSQTHLTFAVGLHLCLCRIHKIFTYTDIQIILKYEIFA